MPITLTTSLNGQTVVKITAITMNVTDHQLEVVAIIGTPDENGFVVRGPPGATCKRRMLIEGAPFDALVASPVVEGESLWDAVKRIAYAKLQATYPELAGTLE